MNTGKRNNSVIGSVIYSRETPVLDTSALVRWLAAKRDTNRALKALDAWAAEREAGRAAK